MCAATARERGREFNAVWQLCDGPAWQARHGLTNDQYQAAFDDLTQQGFRLVCVSGYAENGQARYAGIWEQREGPDWQARHGLSRSQYQQTFDQMAADGFAPVQVCGYRVNVDVRFAAIWERRPGLGWVGRHGLTSSEYQKAFDEQLAAGFRLVSVSGYSDTGIARYAAVWHDDEPREWQARHGLDGAAYHRRSTSWRRGGSGRCRCAATVTGSIRRRTLCAHFGVALSGYFLPNALRTPCSTTAPSRSTSTLQNKTAGTSPHGS